MSAEWVMARVRSRGCAVGGIGAIIEKSATSDAEGRRTVQLTKQGHSCIRLDKGGPILVIDPGGYTEPGAVEGVAAVLITHEHPDHFNEGHVRAALDANPDAEVWTLASVAAQLSAAYPGRVHTVGHGDTFSAAGFEVQVHGELHAVIHPDIPRITNVGYLLDGAVFHPGDALTVPEQPVETLLLPINAPWCKVSESADYVREVRPKRVIDIHDALLAELGIGLYGRVLATLTGTDPQHLGSGEAQEL
jgi:L-ascorbate metabolism protein UlaG (beta-lactamase superfamily)